jgi:hypothetical protein
MAGVFEGTAGQVLKGHDERIAKLEADVKSLAEKTKAALEKLLGGKAAAPDLPADIGPDPNEKDAKP